MDRRAPARRIVSCLPETMIHARPLKRPEPWLFSATFSFVAGCEIVAGLTGNRRYQEPSNDGGGPSADGSDSSHSMPDSGGPRGSGGSRGNGGTMNVGARTNMDASVTDGSAATSGAGGGTSSGAAPPILDSGPDVHDTGPMPDSSTEPPSCKEMKGDECQHTDCCSSILIPGGQFPMGRSDKGSDAFAGASDNETPEHNVTVSAFRLDKFEVTVGRFRQFYNAYDPNRFPMAGDGANTFIPGSGWNPAWSAELLPDQKTLNTTLAGNTLATWTTTTGVYETLPITNVTWFEAFAFCAWDGGRLPTEAEWEFAAAGGANNLLYPWGSQDPETHPNYAALDCSGGGTPNQCSLGDVLPVGSRPDGAGFFGQMDLAGSVEEPVLDVWNGSFYSTLAATVVNPANLIDGSGGLRVMRGGNYEQSGSLVRAAARVAVGPANRQFFLGIRCARSP
jgi:formylglycine-generating enzyme required for sulfatase activity